MTKFNSKPDRAAVARCLRDMEKLFGKRPPENDNALREQGEVVTSESELPDNDSTKNGGAA